MFGVFRAGGFAAAALMLASLFAAPAQAADAGSISGSVAAVPAVITTGAASESTSPFQPQSSTSATPMFQPQNSASVPATETEALTVVPTAPVTQQGRPLHELVIAFVDFGNRSTEEDCLAKAVYFEARGETLEGQLAVAQVIMNRAASGRYPPSICGVVTQAAQFSFIRAGQFPRVDEGSECWHKALAIADVAVKHLANEIGSNVLWYHADYVAPSWGRRLTRVAQIGQHIFYS